MKWIISAFLLTAAVSAAIATLHFEKDPRAVAQGRSPKFVARRQHGLMLLTTGPSKQGGGFDLYFASSADVGDSFTPPQRVNSTPGEVSDHGENSPILMTSPDDAMLYAVWNARDPKNPSASHLRFSRSGSMRPSWSEAVTIDDDPQPVSHGFQGAAVAPDGTIYVAWLDMRDAKSEASHHDHTGGTAALYLATSSDGGVTWTKNIRVAARVCPCCRAAIGFSKGRVHVAWRGVDDGDIRDIYVASSSDKGSTWAKPVPVARDGWKIKGCPHVGPAFATRGGTLYITWFSEAGGKPAIYLASSTNGGETFTPKQAVSTGTADPTHPFINATDEKVAIVFQARDARKDAGWGKMGIYYREVLPNGTLSPLLRAGEGKGSATFPTVALGLSGRVFIGWTEPGDDGSTAYLLRGRAIDATASASSSRIRH